MYDSQSETFSFDETGKARVIFFLFIFFYFQIPELISSSSIPSSWRLDRMAEDLRLCNFISVILNFFLPIVILKLIILNAV